MLLLGVLALDDWGQSATSLAAKSAAQFSKPPVGCRPLAAPGVCCLNLLLPALLLPLLAAAMRRPYPHTHSKGDQAAWNKLMYAVARRGPSPVNMVLQNSSGRVKLLPKAHDNSMSCCRPAGGCWLVGMRAEAACSAATGQQVYTNVSTIQGSAHQRAACHRLQEGLGASALH